MKRCVIVGGAKITEYGIIKGLLRDKDFMIYCDSGLNHMDELGAKPDLIVGDFDSCAALAHSDGAPTGNIVTQVCRGVAMALGKTAPDSGSGPSVGGSEFSVGDGGPSSGGSGSSVGDGGSSVGDGGSIFLPISYDDTDTVFVETIILPEAKDDTDTVFAAKEAIKRGFRDFLILGAVGGRFDHSVANASILLMLHESGAKAVLADDFSEMEILADEEIEISDKYRFFSLVSIFGKVSGVNIEAARFPLIDGEINPNYQYAVSNEVLPGQMARVSVKNGRLLLIKDYK